jgi:type I restriction enzyme R subunit
LVNDRIDLEDQLAATAKLIGGKVNVIESTEQLREHLSTEASDLNMVMIHKFSDRVERVPDSVAEALNVVGFGEDAGELMAAETQAAYNAKPLPSTETFGVVNTSERIILCIDEAHRTQGSDMGDNLFEAFPNAARVAFTGTPLISEQHGAKRTVKRFGE